MKGSGEIIEKIVTKQQQKEINRLSTFNDGLSFQRNIIKK